MTYVKKEFILLFLSCTVKVTEIEQGQVIVSIRPVVLERLPHTLTDVLGVKGYVFVLQPGVLRSEGKTFTLYTKTTCTQEILCNNKVIRHTVHVCCSTTSVYMYMYM